MKLAAAPAFALATASLPFAGAVAQERPAEASTSSVQFIDAQNRTMNDARTLAADASHNRIAIVVWGGNRAIQQEAYNAARDLVGMGIPAAFVLAPDGNGVDADAYMQVYAASTPRSEATYGANYANLVRADLRNAGVTAYHEAFPREFEALKLQR
jgi:hypothetical protein